MKHCSVRISCFMLALLLILVGCGGKDDSKKLTGTWTIQAETNNGITKAVETGEKVVLGGDGTVYDAEDYLRVEFFCIHDAIVSWKVITDGTLLFYDSYGDQYGVEYELSGNTLKLIYNDTSYYTFKK